MKVIETERLILRTWKEEDVQKYYEINLDEKVIEFLLGSLTIEQSKAFIEGANKQFEERGYTLFAAELKETGELLGFIGLNYTDFKSEFTPCVEIGWRLSSKCWGQGLAPEGAIACLKFAFEECKLGEIISFTFVGNENSVRVMEKIGMNRVVGGDFAHPKLPLDHRLSKHIRYVIKNPTTRAGF